MIPISIIIQAVAPVFIIALIGLIIRRLDILTAEADSSLLRLTINVLSPCLAFDSIVGNKALESASNLLVAPLVGYSTVALGVAVGLIFGKLFQRTDKTIRNTFAFTVGMYNYGYVPLPLSLYLFDRETAGVLFVHNIGVELALWTLGVALLGEKNRKSMLKNIINVPLLAIVLSVVLNFLGAKEYLPGVVNLTIMMLGQCTIPMGVILIGATIADYMGEFSIQKDSKVIISACLLRLMILPVLFLLVAKWLPCSNELKAVIVLQASMPSAVFPIVMTRHYGGDTPTALRVILSTSIAGILTIPFWVQAGIKFIGLKIVH